MKNGNFCFCNFFVALKCGLGGSVRAGKKLKECSN